VSDVYQIENLTKIYKGSTKRANDQLTLTIQQTEIFGLLGPNGAGKSTLVNQIAGLIRPTFGSIHLFGRDVIKHPALIPHYIALQAQHSIALQALYPEEALYASAQLRGASSAEARRQTRALMEEFQLNHFGKTLIRKLSGGQQTLVNLTLTFIGNRPVQIFDEPTNNLDPVVRRQVWDKLLALNRQGTTIILVTHNVLEAERVIQRVGIINHGQLLASGTPGELKARVDQRVRLELILKENRAEYISLLETLGEAHALTRQHWTVLCNRNTTQHTINQIIARIGLEQLEDFRILTPSLEDVYLQLGGGMKLG
jgi:ABC-2 type transport system ATP-binding protein